MLGNESPHCHLRALKQSLTISLPWSKQRSPSKFNDNEFVPNHALMVACIAYRRKDSNNIDFKDKSINEDEMTALIHTFRIFKE